MLANCSLLQASKMFKLRSFTLLSGLAAAVLLLTLVVAETGEKLKLSASSRIINGDIIKIEDAPYMVQLRNSSDYDFTFCGGSLISQQHILTAAHCVVKPNTIRDTVIVAGAERRNEEGVERTIAKVYIHPDYNRATQAFDVAILKLEKPIEEDAKKIRVLSKLCTIPPPVGEYLQITGWGLITKMADPNTAKYKDISQELRKVRLPVISDDECKQKNGRLPFGPTMICAYDNQRAHNAGDSGGPALYGKQLCGIVSWSRKSDTIWYPGVYTSIPTVLPFIQEKLKL